MSKKRLSVDAVAIKMTKSRRTFIMPQFVAITHVSVLLSWSMSQSLIINEVGLHKSRLNRNLCMNAVMHTNVLAMHANMYILSAYYICVYMYI